MAQSTQKPLRCDWSQLIYLSCITTAMSNAKQAPFPETARPITYNSMKHASHL
ncbi:hypothetical protein FH972_024843 [Carpinus fangiana]|uniref:Uncharacterized protein n=1 Tax=Carpinus fangiana TaxID=176857 RepID=A0A5N6KZH3_9ROSI|nr:hypothetical protein FH972_024843 [Carpinus fangiana]